MDPPSINQVTGRSLAIVGASTRAAAYSAMRAGYRPITADLFADADLRHIATTTQVSPYPEGLLDWIRTVEPVAWMYTGALENHPELVDAMGWLAPLWGNSGDVLKCIRQPWNLKDALLRAGLEFPETRQESHGLPHDGSWLSKTYRGASGSGVREFVGPENDTPEALPTVADESSSAPSALVYQQRVTGTACSAVFIGAQNQAKLLGITRQLVGEAWLGAHDFQYAGSIGPWSVDEKTFDTICAIGNVLAERFELVGLFGVDFMLDGSHVWTLEVNPRYTASVEIVERVHGVSAIADHVAACVRGELPEQVASSRGQAGAQLKPSTIAAAGKAVLYARDNITISASFADWSLAQALEQPWPALGDVSTAGTSIETGRPVLTCFAEGEDVALVESSLRSRVVEIERRLYQN